MFVPSQSYIVPPPFTFPLPSKWFCTCTENIWDKYVSEHVVPESLVG